MGTPFTTLTNGLWNGTTTNITTGVITPLANRLIALSYCAHEPVPNVPTVTGCNLTWIAEPGMRHNHSTRYLSFFRAMGSSPTTGAVTITWSSSVQTVEWEIAQSGDDVDTSGTNGSGAIGQIGTPQNEGNLLANPVLTVPINTFAQPTNTTFAVSGGTQQISSVAYEAGYTRRVNGPGTSSVFLATGHLTSQDTSVVSTFTTVGGWGIAVACEIKSAGAPPPGAKNYYLGGNAMNRGMRGRAWAA